MVLLQSSKAVVAVEIDKQLANQLPITMASHIPDRVDALTVVNDDALNVRSSEPTATALVVNLPYNVSVPVILHVLENFPAIQKGIVMVQAEVAERLAAQPGSKVYGVPSVKIGRAHV